MDITDTTSLKAKTMKPIVSRKSRGGSRSPTRDALIWCGTELLTERGFHAIGIEDVLRQVGVPKGSFYHFFESKQAFLEAVVENCREYYCLKYEKILLNSERTCLERIREFGDSAMIGMERFEFKRGCLVGNLGQELSSIDQSLASTLDGIMTSWEVALSRCLSDGVASGEIPQDTDVQSLSQFFFTGWQGALLRCKMKRSIAPLGLYVDVFISRVLLNGSQPASRRRLPVPPNKQDRAKAPS